ncbi:MAG: PQQ-binding-like beta-propeller repeat protein [Thermoanaerobaculia bacterium]|nr:PQQ-binding-like beta-propeller repeat protein [Thermoanaerobaculia bacterium]
MCRLRLLLPTLLLLLTTSSSATDWPQFRGPQRDGISKEKGIARSWPAQGPKVLWSLDVAQGYSGAAIVAGVVYFNDYDEAAGEWLVRAVTLADGKELWRFREARRIRPNHGITRTVPAVDGARVFTLDPKSVLHALDAKTGKELWRKDFVADFGGQIPPWYNGQCPLLERDRVVVAPGGSALVVALKKDTGAEIWRTPNPEKWPMSHASLMPATLGGVAQYLYSTLFGTVGVAAADGRLLWHFPFKFNVAVAPSPLALPGDKVLITAGYDAGSAIFKVVRAGDSWRTEMIKTLGPDVWNSEIHTPILHDGHLFAVGKHQRGLFTCLDLEGNVVWTSAGQASFELGSFLLADGVFFILDGKTGLLRLVEARTDAYKELAKAQVLSGHDVWAPMALADGKLVIRDMGRMVCLEVGKGG